MRRGIKVIGLQGKGGIECKAPRTYKTISNKHKNNIFYQLEICPP